MRSARLRVPYCIVSSLKSDDWLEQRIQTPIGGIDIRLHAGDGSADGKAPVTEIYIEADIVLEPAPAVFSRELCENLANFSYDIVRQSMSFGTFPHCALRLRLKNDQTVRHFVRDYDQGRWRDPEDR